MLTELGATSLLSFFNNFHFWLLITPELGIENAAKCMFQLIKRKETRECFNCTRDLHTY